jgi:hypothetical protein
MIGPSPDEIISPFILVFDPVEDATASVGHVPVPAIATRLRGPNGGSRGSGGITQQER